MTMTLSGDGTITGLSAGGLPNSSVTSDDIATSAITTAKIADANITAAKLDGAQSGSAPIYAARAWVNFNGTGTVAIRASGNVSSITDNGTGNYTVNFTTAMSDANYAAVYGAMASLTAGNWAFVTTYLDGKTTTGLQILIKNDAGTGIDSPSIAVAIFR